MDELSKFVVEITKLSNNKELSIEEKRGVVQLINDFLFTTYEGIGKISALGKEFPYFSEFHKFWDKNYKVILNAQINDQQCAKVADVFHDIYIKTKGKAFSTSFDPCRLEKAALCRVRMLTANQDFNGSRDFAQLATLYRVDPSIFNLDNILDNPGRFINEISVLRLGQPEKRVQYAKSIAEFIKNKVAEPIDLISYYNNDVYQLRQELIGYPSAGYGNKKTDMLIRDMVVLGVWQDVKNFEKIDVASDVNTIKIALRSGILQTSIPLLSSFLDYFGNQYGYIDEMSAKAWRRVWEIWVSKYPSDSISSPCLLDFFVYNVLGREICKEILYEFKCDSKEHTFFWHSGRNKTCQICNTAGVRNKATVINRMLPCESKEGIIAIKETKFYNNNICNPNITQCPLKDICDEYNKKNLGTPKSISILGQTGWETAYVKKGDGGGGLMS